LDTPPSNTFDTPVCAVLRFCEPFGHPGFRFNTGGWTEGEGSQGIDWDACCDEVFVLQHIKETLDSSIEDVQLKLTWLVTYQLQWHQVPGVPLV
jgi:hypothetical protein